MADKKIKLFCFPYAGGSARIYKQWQKYLPKEMEIVPVEVRGRGVRYGERFCENMNEMVEDVFTIIKDDLGENSYAIFGHSMGAVIAYEVCYRIIESGFPTPLHLFLTGRGAPQFRDEEEKTYLLPDDKFKEKLMEYGGTPEEVLKNDELMKIFTPILRADFKICDTYEHKPRNYKFDFGITVMTGIEENLTGEQIEGWQVYTNKKINIHKFPGGHFFIHEYTLNVLRLVCKKIYDELEEVKSKKVG